MELSNSLFYNHINSEIFVIGRLYSSLLNFFWQNKIGNIFFEEITNSKFLNLFTNNDFLLKPNHLFNIKTINDSKLCHQIFILRSFKIINLSQRQSKYEKKFVVPISIYKPHIMTEFEPNLKPKFEYLFLPHKIK